MAECGTLVIEEPFDPTAVQVIEGTCALGTGGPAAPTDSVSLSAEVANPNNVTARATVSWAATDLPSDPAVARVRTDIPPGGTTVTTSFVPEEVTNPELPREFSSNIRAIVLPSVEQSAPASAPASNAGRGAATVQLLPAREPTNGCEPCASGKAPKPRQR